MTFDSAVYDAIRAGARSSARVVAPLLVDETIRPHGVELRVPFDVLDVGCGEGWWSAAIRDASPLVKEVISIDEATPATTAPGVNVQILDLERGDAVHLVGAAFGLTVCLEVAEHVSPAAGDDLVAMLCAVTDPAGAIAFSAAIPGQGGHHHVNEQWPSYWDERFRAQGWRLSDPLRERLWDDERVEPWYRQNLLVAVAPAANGTAWAAGGSPRSLVHPDIWRWRIEDRDHWREKALAAEDAAERWEQRARAIGYGDGPLEDA